MAQGRIRRLITRRRAKWVGLVGAVLLLAVYVASIWFAVNMERFNDVSQQNVLIESGHLRVMWMGAEEQSSEKVKYQLFRFAPEPRIDFSWSYVSEPAFEPSGPPGQYGFVVIPLWFPLLLTALPTAYLFWLDRRAKPWQCAKCRYDLRGLDGGVCPECGHELKPSNAAGVVD